MSKSNNHQLIARACTSLASATLCATIFLASNTNNVKASAMSLPVQSNVAKNVNQANHVIPDNNLFNSRHIMPRIGTDDWQNVDYSYDETTKTLTIKGGTLINPTPVGKTISIEIKKINITGKLALEGSINSLFYGLKDLKEINGAKNIDTSQVTDMSWMFYGCGVLNGLDVSNWNTSQVTKMSWMFGGCNALDGLDVSSWNTSKATNMNGMFDGCNALDSLNVSNWNTSKVTDMSNMFDGCSALDRIDVSNWNTSKVTDMAGMFSSCNVLDGLDVSNWDTSQVTDMAHMFFDCNVLDRLDVSNWDTSKVTNMLDLFYDCYVLNGLDVSKWNTSQVTDMCGVFYDCYALDKLDVSGWDTSKVTDMRWMFENCQKLSKIDVSNWDTSKVKYMISMLYGLSSLVELRLGPNINIAKAGLNTPVEWISVGKGTITKPTGTEYYSSDELSKFWNDKNYTETWVRGTKAKVTINYIDLDDNNKIIQTDSLSGAPDHVVEYKTAFNKIVADLKDKHYEYVASEDKLPWSNGQIQLPDDVTDNTTYTVGFKHIISNVKDGDKNPVTGDTITGLNKTIKQTIKYTGMPNNITDNVQTVKFTRGGKVDLVTGKIEYLDWNEEQQSFKDVASPKVTGYEPDNATVKGATVKPTDGDITREVKYTRGNYKITINYIDTDDNKVVKTDTVNGNPEKVIAYKDQMDSIVKSLTGYVLNKEKTNLPLDSDGNIKLADDILTDVEYQVGLKHDSKTMHAGEKNSVTGKDEDGLTKIITQTIKYTGIPSSIADNVQKVTFKRDADVDMVTGKLTYHDWDNKELSFKDVDSPKVAGYEPDITTVKGTTVKPTDSNITKEVKYSRGSYNIQINYVDSNDNDKVIKTDKVSGNPDKVISYQDQLKQILHDLTGYVIDKDKTTLPLDSNNDIKLPDSVIGDKDYQVVLKHDSKTMHAGDKNPVTGKDEDGLTKIITQTIKYTGAPNTISDNVQKVTFKRSADVDMVTGKLTYHDWDNKELSFKDITSPTVKGYNPDIVAVKGATVKPTDSDITKEVKYSRGSYNITINYVDSNDNDKVIKTDKVAGNPDKVISYQDQLKQILHDLSGYVIDKDKTTLPLDGNNDIKLPDSVTGDKDYQVVLKHDSKIMHAGDKNPVTGKDEDGLAKTITQTIKYTGVPSAIADNVQKVTFKRSADVDMVTGKLTYYDWDNKELSFKDVDSPTVTGYDANPSSIKGATVTPDSNDITKTVSYVRSNYGIKINYVDGDDNNTILKTDTIEGNPEKAIAYKDKMTSIINSLTGYSLNKAKTDLPLNENGDIQLPPDVLGSQAYNVVLNHKITTMKPGDKNPVTGKDENGLIKVVTRTIKYTGTPSSINDKVQQVTFMRNATVDLVTGKLTYLDWDKDSQTLAEVVSPKVAGYTADPEIVKAQTAKPDDNDTTVTVKYSRGSYNININYVDSNTGKVVKTDKVSGNPDKAISYQDQLKQILHDLPGYVIDKDKTTLPLDDNNDIKLPDSVTGDKDYQIVLKHDSKTMHAGEQNPVTGKDEDGLTKTITQTIKYTGMPTAISDNIQKVTFKRDAAVDMVTGELTYHDWDNKELAFKDVTSPVVDGYDADIAVVKGVTVKPTDSDVTKTVTYTKKEAPSYDITINYQDDTGKVIKTDKQKGKAGTTIQYHDKLEEIVNQIGNGKYEIDKDKSNLPLDKNNDIKLPDDLAADHDYHVVLKHKIVTIKPGDNNPVTGELASGLTKEVKQIVKYTGANKDISANVQTVKFTRNGQVDLVTGKLTYLEWHEGQQSFKDVVSPTVSGYTPDIAMVKSTSVTADSSDITKQVTYTKDKQDKTDKNDPDYEITIDYQDENGKTIKTDKQKGKANSTIQYKDRMQEIINSIAKNGYEVDWSKSNLPVDSDGNIKLGAITGNTTYKLVLKHKIVTFRHGEKNPFTGEEDPNLEHKVTQTIKYLHSGKDLPNNVQELTFTRDAQVDMITGKVKYLTWHEEKQTFKDVTSPTVNGYKPDLAIVKGRTVTGDSKNIVQLVTYNKVKVVQTGLDLARNEQSTILGTIVAAFVGILTYFGILKKKGKKD